MNKKAAKKIDDKEDKKIRKVAYSKNSSQILLLFVLIILFGFTLFCTLVYVGDYYKNKEELKKSSEIIEINTAKGNATIINSGKINKIISNEDVATNENITLENMVTIELKTNANSENDSSIYFDIKYDIKKNDFPYHFIASNDSDSLVRFSYSYDNKEWHYVKNVISTTDSTLNPLMGNYYDIAGLTTTLRIVTNIKLTSKPGKSTKMYWKCETLIKNNKDNIDKEIEADFKIEYKDND